MPSIKKTPLIKPASSRDNDFFKLDKKVAMACAPAECPERKILL